MKSVSVRIFALAAIVCALASPALSQDRVKPTTIPQLLSVPAPAPAAIQAAPSGSAGGIAAPSVPPPTAFVPVPDALSLGTLAGQALTWIAATFSVPAGAYLVLILSKLLQGVGVSVDDAMRARLQALAVNGLNFGASKIASAIDGKVPVNFKSQLVADAVAYVQLHGGDVLKKLGADPMADATIKAITARIEGALVDPNVPISISPIAVPEPNDPATAPKASADPLAVVTDAVHKGFDDLFARLKLRTVTGPVQAAQPPVPQA